jgi:hypothetical protein
MYSYYYEVVGYVSKCAKERDGIGHIRPRFLWLFQLLHKALFFFISFTHAGRNPSPTNVKMTSCYIMTSRRCAKVDLFRGICWFKWNMSKLYQKQTLLHATTGFIFCIFYYPLIFFLYYWYGVVCWLQTIWILKENEIKNRNFFYMQMWALLQQTLVHLYIVCLIIC